MKWQIKIAHSHSWLSLKVSWSNVAARSIHILRSDCLFQTPRRTSDGKSQYYSPVSSKAVRKNVTAKSGLNHDLVGIG